MERGRQRGNREDVSEKEDQKKDIIVNIYVH